MYGLFFFDKQTEVFSWRNPQNSACGIVTHRRNTTLICSFLKEVWGECGEAGKGKVTYRRYAPVPNLIRLSVQYDFVLCTLRFSLVLNFSRSLSIYNYGIFFGCNERKYFLERSLAKINLSRILTWLQNQASYSHVDLPLLQLFQF